MEHLTVCWKPEFDETKNVWLIVTDEENPWTICEIERGLPGDDTGERTVLAVCDEHNNLVASNEE